MLPRGDRHVYYSHATVIDNYTPYPINGRPTHTVWIHRNSEDMGHPKRQFCHRVKLLKALQLPVV